MTDFSAISFQRLGTCHPDHRGFWPIIVAEFDCAILCGARGKKEQHSAFLAGLSHTDWPNSKHNCRPAVPETRAEWDLPLHSYAIDVFPVPEKGWPITPESWKDRERFYYFGGWVLARAKNFGVNLRWGGDWDGDGKLRDQNFFDLVHFEIRRP